MTIPKPTDLRFRFAAAWAYITVPVKRGHTQTVEYEDRGDWYTAAVFGDEWLVPMHQVGQTEFRTRYTRAGEHSAWTTGRVWMPDGHEVDGDDPIPPRPTAPYDLRNRWSSSGQVELRWSQDGEVDDWRVIIAHDSAVVFDQVVDRPLVSASELGFDVAFTVTIRARRSGVESGPLEIDLPSANWRPTTPTRLVVDATDVGLTLAWSQPDDDVCQAWQVWWRKADDEAAAIADPEVLDGMIAPGARSRSGNVRVYDAPTYLIRDLEPGTMYHVLIAAVWRHSSYSHGTISEYHATTGGDGLRTPVLRAGRVTETSVEVLWDDDPAATGWVVRRSPGHSRHRPTGQPRWLAEGLSADTSYEFGVIAVDDDHGLESDEATITIITDGSKPVPERPRPPQGLRAHCITARTAKIEWDDAPVAEQVDKYKVAVVGEAEREVIGTLVEVTDLEPETPHSVTVRACAGSVCSEASTVDFTTGADEPDPEPDPPGQVPAPTGLFLDPVGPGEVDAYWTQPGGVAAWWLVTGDERVWKRVTKPQARVEVPPGQQRSIAVYALVDGNPSKISQIVRKDVVTAVKGA